MGEVLPYECPETILPGGQALEWLATLATEVVQYFEWRRLLREIGGFGPVLSPKAAVVERMLERTLLKLEAVNAAFEKGAKLLEVLESQDEQVSVTGQSDDGQFTVTMGCTVKGAALRVSTLELAEVSTETTMSKVASAVGSLR